jgi:hypothetical protein
VTVVLGLDFGTKQGFTRFDTVSGDLLLGFIDWGKVPHPDRVIQFGYWLEGMLSGQLVDATGQRISGYTEPVNVIGYEGTPFTGTRKGKSKGGQGSAFMNKQEGLVQWLGRYVAWQAVHAGTLKKFATGDGRAEKSTMVAAAKYGIRALGAVVPVKLKEDTADAFLVTTWILMNSLHDWTPPSIGGQHA